MMKQCSVMFAAVMFVDCVAVWAAAAVLAYVLVLSVVAAAAAVLAAMTVWNAVVELPAAAASTASVAVAACFAGEHALLSSVSMDLLLKCCMWLSECLLKVLL